MVLFKTPIAVCLVREKSCHFDLAMLLILMTAKSSEGGKVLSAEVASMTGWLNCWASNENLCSDGLPGGVTV